MHDVEETQDIVILRLHIEGSFSICIVNPMVCELWNTMDVLWNICIKPVKKLRDFNA